MHHSVFFALGSNLGEKQKNIENALDNITKRIGRIISLSAFYVTTPDGFFSEHDFVNCVCEVVTELDIWSLFSITQDIEKELGRSVKSINGIYADRLIDIDLILAGDMVIHTPELTLPHPAFHLRDFVLAPMNEIAPEVVHPLMGKTIRTLKEELDHQQYMK